MTTPYESDAEHLRDELGRLDLLLRRHLAAWRAERGGAGEHGGLYVSGQQVEALLAAPAASDGGDSVASAGQQSGSAAGEQNTSPAEDHTGSPGAEQAELEWRSTAHGEPDGSRDLVERYTAAIGERADAIAARERATVEDGRRLRLPTLADRFELDRTEVDALLVALAPELDLKYEKIYAHLQDDLARKRPTVGLVSRVLEGAAGGAFEYRPLFGEDATLVADQLLTLSGADGSLLAQYVEVDRRIVSYLLGDDDLDGRVSGVAERFDPADGAVGSIEAAAVEDERDDADGADGDPVDADVEPTDADGKSDASDTADAAPTTARTASAIDRLPIAFDRRQDLERIAERVASERSILVALDGPYGAGLDDAVRAICTRAELPVITVRADRLRSETAAETLALLVREARLADAALHVSGLAGAEGGTGAADGTDGDRADAARQLDRDAVLRGVTAYDSPVFLTGSEPLALQRAGRIEPHDVVTLDVGAPSFDRRRCIWARTELPEGVDPDDLAATFQLTPGQIEDAVESARSIAVDGEPTAEQLRTACRAQSRERLGELATSMEPRYELEDIVLPDDEREQLETVLTHVEQRGRVFSDWGFEESTGKSGVNVLFSGPSGTGKTMAAEIVASETGLDCYRIDLATVVSKYIGETEGNLRRIFDEAEASNAVLLFDEADALFGERTEVQDAHDRYANVEVNYLLQRMEAHDGVVILTTNLAENVDDAFRRRINVDVEFPMPDADARERIWRSVFPEATPCGDLDWSFLASFDLTGGDIDTAATTAAFLAAEDGGVVEMRHVVRALYRALQKSGRLFSADDFGPYRELVN